MLHNSNNDKSISTSAYACPLCGGGDAILMQKTQLADIWKALEIEWKVKFSLDTINENGGSEFVGLLECGGCGLQYFWPSHAGSESFYRELSACVPYADDKWEFSVVSNSVTGSERLLDIACATGKFLNRVQSVCQDVWGIDTNSDAINIAKSASLNVECVGIDVFSKKNHARFDVVTSFQVLEHVTDINGFIAAALTCLKDGGTLFISVPNRHRSFQKRLEPLDFPPHHLSRWSEKQLRKLASLNGCEMKWAKMEPIPYSHMVEVFIEKIPKCLPVFISRTVIFVIYSPVIHKIFQYFNFHDRFNYCGMSILCCMTKKNKV